METRKINKKVDSGGHFQVTYMKGEAMLYSQITIYTILNGDMRYYRYHLVASDLYDKWFRLNIIHNVDDGNVQFSSMGSKNLW